MVVTLGRSVVFYCRGSFFGLDCGFNHVYYVVCSKEKAITRTLHRDGLRLQMKKIHVCRTDTFKPVLSMLRKKICILEVFTSVAYFKGRAKTGRWSNPVSMVVNFSAFLCVLCVQKLEEQDRKALNVKEQLQREHRYLKRRLEQLSVSGSVERIRTDSMGSTISTDSEQGRLSLKSQSHLSGLHLDMDCAPYY